MRKLKLLILIQTISCSAFSQDLKPIVQELNGDTLFCFTISQSKEIAKRIQSNTYCDSLILEQQELVELLDKLNTTKDSITTGLEKKVWNLEQMNQNQENNIELLEKSLEVKDKKLKKSKAHKILLGIGLGLMTTLVIVN